MNARWLTIISDCLVLIGLIILGSGWQGSGNLTGALPFHGSSVSLTGSATGLHALLGVPSVLIGSSSWLFRWFGTQLRQSNDNPMRLKSR